MFDEPPLDARAWLDRIRGRDTDAAFLIQRSAALGIYGVTGDQIYDELGLTIRLASGPGTPESVRAPVFGVKAWSRSPARCA